MDIDFEKGNVVLYGKNNKIDTLVRKMAQMSGEQVYHFLSNRSISVPRSMNCLALMAVLNKKIKFLNTKSLSKDYFERLKYYEFFTEQQLFNLFLRIANDKESFLEYRLKFFNLFIRNFVALDINDGELMYVKNINKAHTESFEQYFNYISGALVEQEDTFDGRTFDVLKEHLKESASKNEIYDIANKYGIIIPQSLKRDEFLNFIVWYLKKNNKYNQNIEDELKDLSISDLALYAKRVGIPMNQTLSKDDAITYLFYMLDSSKIETTSVKRYLIPEEYKPLKFTVDTSAISHFGKGEAEKVIHYEGEENDLEAFQNSLVEKEEKIENAEIVTKEEPVLTDAVDIFNETTAFNREDAIINENEIKDNTTSSETEIKKEEIEGTKEMASSILDELDIKDDVNEKNTSTDDDEILQDLDLENRDETEFESLDDDIEKTNDDLAKSILDDIEKDEIKEEEQVVEEPKEEKELSREVTFNVKAERPKMPTSVNDDINDLPDLTDEEINQILKAHQEDVEEFNEKIEQKMDIDTSVVKNDLYGSKEIERLTESKKGTIVLSIILGIMVLVLAYIVYALVK